MVELSPPVGPVKYKRGKGEEMRVEPVQYGYDGFGSGSVEDDGRLVRVDSDWLLFYGEIGDVYVADTHACVPETVYRMHNMVMLREYVYIVLNRLSRNNIIAGWGPM